MHFGENQLSPSLIGLSPLPTAHPPGFQPWWVRSSTRSYPRFNLAMGRSPGFGSRARDYRHRSATALFGLALATATPHGLTSPRTANSQAHSSKGTLSRPHTRCDDAPTACRRAVSGTISLPSRYSCLHSHSRGVHGWITPPLRPPHDAPLPIHTPGRLLEGTDGAMF